MIPADARELFERLLELEADEEGQVVIDPEVGPQVPCEKLVELAQGLKDLDYRFLVYCASAHFPAASDDEVDECMTTYCVRRLGRGSVTAAFHLRVPYGTPTPSLVSVWVGADWQEREQYDLVGALFSDHPDLRRIMMPEDWPGHPLRRDYPIDTPHFPWR